jgi:hypothetical protein
MTLAQSRTLRQLAGDVGQPNFQALVLSFLREKMNMANIDIEDLPKISVFNSALAIVHAPSDPSGVGGMCREFIRATASWRGSNARYDCVFYKEKASPCGMHDLHIVRVHSFFQLHYRDTSYSCALVHWFKTLDDEADEDTGMWKVEPVFDADGKPWATIVEVKNLHRAAHLLPIFGSAFVEEGLTFDQTLDRFRLFYVNRFIDHNSFYLAS